MRLAPENHQHKILALDIRGANNIVMVNGVGLGTTMLVGDISKKFLPSLHILCLNQHINMGAASQRTGFRSTLICDRLNHTGGWNCIVGCPCAHHELI